MTDATRVLQHTYKIRAQDGSLEALHVRKDLPLGRKHVSWQLPNGTKGLGGRAAKTLPLYRSETLRALKPGALVLVCEGEKDTDAAVALEFDAVGTVTGSSGLPTDEVLRTLDRFHVVVWPDLDVVGSRHMGRLLEACYRLRGGMGAGLSQIVPGRLGLTGKGDGAADWTPTGDPLDELFAAIQPFAPPERPPRDDSGPPPVDDVPPPQDDPEQSTGHLIPEGKTRAGLRKALEWLGIDVRFNERSARLELQDAVEAAAGRPQWEASDDMRGAKLREMIADACLVVNAKGDPTRMQFGRERWGDVLDAILDESAGGPVQNLAGCAPRVGRRGPDRLLARPRFHGG